ncbi:hypothetical protein [Pseudomonas sp. NW5]|uniref:hypothetical protein n=1 Tax=Pseudomonas sp. NW5 TaxID=2934934 RepID=UPI00202158F3|nr:hypothetical protein [Pseudomonas sp. NW5]MCL7463015.1 hypothetical protein [Pseudomonas sp. NW5]
MSIRTLSELRRALSAQAALLSIEGPLAEQLQAAASVATLHAVEVRALRNLTTDLRRSRDRSAPALLAQQSGLAPETISALLVLGLATCLNTWQRYQQVSYQADAPRLLLQHRRTLPQLDTGEADAAGNPASAAGQ